MSAVTEWDGHVDEDNDAFVAAETFYGSADEFVREFLTMTYRRAPARRALPSHNKISLTPITRSTHGPDLRRPTC